MNTEQYQELTGLTALPSIKGNLQYYGLGLGSEIGEVVEKLDDLSKGLAVQGAATLGKLKKQMRDGDLGPTDKDIAKELGGCMWYISEMCTAIGWTIEDVIQLNADVLVSRKKRGVIGGSGDDR